MDHAIDTPHTHGHGHDHDHSHDHAHDHGMGEYYAEQLLTVFVSGAFGVAGVLMYYFKMLDILAESFRLPVLLGGFGLIGLTLFRGVALWMSVGGDHFHDHHAGHNHAPGEACDHPAPAHDDHDHEEHAHGNMYWRIVVLAFPIVIFAMYVPGAFGSYSEAWVNKRLGSETSLGALSEVKEKEGEAVYKFEELSNAAASAERREALTGTKAVVIGQLRRIPGSQTEFGLFFLKMTCCATDMVPLRARVVASSASVADSFARVFKNDKGNEVMHPWVKVSGTLQFVEDSTGAFVTVLRVKDLGGITPTMPEY